MIAARRTALVSVAAAAVLIALKLSVGLATNSLGLMSEAAHSGTDLVAALLTFFALGVAGRPADDSHPWGHGKAEHLSALAEALILAAISGLIIWHAVRRLTGDAVADVDAAWYAFVVIGIVIAVDLARTVVSLRSARKYDSAALFGNAVHFGADLVGTVAVLAGLLLVRAGYDKADAWAALFVAMLVLVAAWNVARKNIDVLMDRTAPDAEHAARAAIESLSPAVSLERLRVRSAAGRHFADVVISISPSAALAEGHTLADRVEEAVEGALPGVDVVVHVEPGHTRGSLQERALAAALTVPGVREIHDVQVRQGDGGTDVSLHLKFPSDATLHDAHEHADAVEAAIIAAVPQVDRVTTHLEPLTEAVGRAALPPGDNTHLDDVIRTVVHDVAGERPSDVRIVVTDAGLVAFVTVRLDGGLPLVHAHELGGAVRARLTRELPDLADVFVHTEPHVA